MKVDTLCTQTACLLVLSFILLFVLPLLILPSIGDSTSYATSDSSNETSNDEPQPGTILVTKQVINEGGGSARPSDFTITVDGNNPTPASFDGSSSGTTVQLLEGRYRITESGATSSYDSTLSRGCSGNIRAGESKVCTITNTYSASPPPVTTGEIIVTKRVINEGGGSARPSDFTITVDGNNPTPALFDGSSSGTTVTLEPGGYSVTENPLPDYTSSSSNGCTGTVSAGQTKQCVITNTYSASPPPVTTGEIIVTKRVINEGGGSARPSDFTITVDGNNPTPALFDGSSSGTTVTLEPGGYSVTENPLPDYTSSSSNGCTGTVSAGQTKQCVITNWYLLIDRPAQLIVIKNVVNSEGEDSDLTLRPSAFTMVVHGNDPLPRSFPGKSGDGVVVNLNPGRYSVSEEEIDGYTADYSDSCQGTIRAEETRVCMITNEESSTPPSPSPPKPLPEIQTIDGFLAPYGIALDPGNGMVYVSNYGQFNTTGIVSVINDTANTMIGNVPVGKNPQAISYNPSNGFFYVANTLSNTLSLINGTSNSLIGSIRVGEFPGKNPAGIVTNPINNTIYVTNMGSNTVSVINGTTNAVVANVTSATREGEGSGFFSPAGIAYDSDNGNVYVANRGSDTISVINGSTNLLIDEISMDTVAPSGIVYNAANNLIYATSEGSNRVSMINGTTNTVVATIPVGLGPTGIAYDQSNGNVFVSNSANGTISIIDGLKNNVTGTISLGTNRTPNGVLYNPDTDSLFVADTNSSTVHVIKNP